MNFADDLTNLFIIDVTDRSDDIFVEDLVHDVENFGSDATLLDLRAVDEDLSLPRAFATIESTTTLPMNKLAVLRAAAREAVDARDAIADLSSPEWASAHEEAMVACQYANAELLRLGWHAPTTSEGVSLS